jgi:hypothetical protein
MRNRSISRGFTLIELGITLVFILVGTLFVGGIGWNFLFNRPGQTEARATEAMKGFIATNNVTGVQRSSCAHDSDNDGLASCTVVTMPPNGSENRINLQCPASLGNVMMGATSCKEIEFTMSLGTKRR